jgi:hypothetical protein
MFSCFRQTLKNFRRYCNLILDERPHEKYRQYGSYRWNCGYKYAKINGMVVPCGGKRFRKKIFKGGFLF